MDTKLLARHYHAFTPWERLPLMVAAAIRDDDVEIERLARAAPRLGWRLPDYYGLITAVHDLAMLYLVRQMELVALYWRATTLEQQRLVLGLAKHGKEDALLNGLRKMYALHVLVHADAWKHLCADLEVDGDALLRDAPGYEALQEMQREAHHVAFKPEEAVKFLRKHLTRLEPKGTRGHGAYRVAMPAAVDVAASMRAYLEYKAKEWT